MSEQENSDSSTSESEVSACSSNFNPLKVLYSQKTKIPENSAPLYENIQQYEAALKNQSILPVGAGEAVKKREEEKQKKKQEEEERLLEKNKARFAQYEDTLPQRTEKVQRNVLTRLDATIGPLATLKDCVDHRLRIKMANEPTVHLMVTTRSDRGVRGVLHATLVAFDKQWNLALTDVLEIWTRKPANKRKIPPAMGTPVPKGTAAGISPVPVVTETPIGKRLVECTRHLPQLLVRGEHVVMINIVER